MIAKQTGRIPAIRRNALTMVELLVAMAALSLLLGQVVPAAKHLRQNSKELSCQDKLGQIAEAALAYAHDDSSEFVVPIGRGDAAFTSPKYANYGFGGKSGVGHTGIVQDSMWGGANWMGAVDRPLNAVLYKRTFKVPPAGPRGGTDWLLDTREDVSVFHCPSDDGFPGMHYRGWRNEGSSSYDHFGTSYMATPLFIAIGGDLSDFLSNSPYMRPASGVPNPANTILYLENAARFAHFANNPEEYDQSECFWPYEYGDQIAHGWHGTPFLFNMAFVDGHVANMNMKGYGLAELPPGLPPDCQGGPLCECLLKRGHGWQMDTLPAPFMETHKRIGSRPGEPTDIYDIVPLEPVPLPPPPSTPRTNAAPGAWWIER